MENPKEEILLPPGYTLLEFGDGYIALTGGGIETKDKDGKTVVKFMIEPTMALRKRYDIPDSMLNNNRQMEYTVLKSDLVYMNIFDDANRKILYLKTYDKEEADIGKHSWNLRKRLEESEKKIWLLEGELISLFELLELAKNNPIEYLSQLADAFSNVSQPMLDLLNAKKGKEGNEND